MSSFSPPSLFASVARSTRLHVIGVCWLLPSVIKTFRQDSRLMKFGFCFTCSSTNKITRNICNFTQKDKNNITGQNCQDSLICKIFPTDSDDSSMEFPGLEHSARWPSSENKYFLQHQSVWNFIYCKTSISRDVYISGLGGWRLRTVFTVLLIIWLKYQQDYKVFPNYVSRALFGKYSFWLLFFQCKNAPLDVKFG